MKKLMFVLLIILSAAMLVACDNKKSDNGGGGGTNNTPIVLDNYPTYIGNYAVNSIVARPAAGSSDLTAYNTADKKQITDYDGIVVIDNASASQVNLRGSVKVGGNTFIGTLGSVPPTAQIGDLTLQLDPALLNVDVVGQTIRFTTTIENATEYEVVMKKVNDSTSVDINKALWAEKGLCYRTALTSGNGKFFNCMLSSGVPGDGDITTENGVVKYTPPINPITSATKLIGNYYIEKIDFVDKGTNTGCDNMDVVLNGNPNGLVGELAAAANGSVLLKLGLKFQFDMPGCNIFNKGVYYFEEYDDKIALTGGLDLDKIFAEEGLTVTETETIEYTPRVKQDPTCVAAKDAPCVYVDKTFNGATLKITLKKARDGALKLSGTPTFAKPLTDEKYY